MEISPNPVNITLSLSHMYQIFEKINEIYDNTDPLSLPLSLMVTTILQHDVNHHYARFNCNYRYKTQNLFLHVFKL